MKKGLLLVAAICLFLALVPAAMAEQTDAENMGLTGTWSVGLGGGFSDKDVAPVVVSGKYWDPSWELGGEVFTVFQSESTDYDQLIQAWLAYRYDIMMGDDPSEGIPYVGIGIGAIFEDFNEFENAFGPIGIIGWDSGGVWGVELKGAWYDPMIFSGVVYYHFNEE
jgi:hypothetical protein